MRKRALVAMALFALLGGFPVGITADEASYQIQPTDNLRGILQARVGEQLYIQTRNGSEINGKLEAVGEQVIQVSRIAGRDFYDAVVRIDAVETVIVKVRGPR